MEIENSGDFGIFKVIGVCLELQRGQVRNNKNSKKNSMKNSKS